MIKKLSLFHRTKSPTANFACIDTHHVDVLDGIRAIAILIVAWFHIWQQSWLMPTIQTPFLSKLNIPQIDFNWLPATGYEMVDMMLLLSGFCLFLPHARHMILGTPLPNTKSFYKKRAARILPSYLFCIFFFLFVFNLPNHVYADTNAMWKDLLPHLTFTHTYTKEAYIFTRLNGVLWTLAIEVQFYLIFPMVAKAFRKKPFLTYFIMVASSWYFIEGIVIPKHSNDLLMWINQLPTFFGVYANGMMGALLFVSIAQLLNNTLSTSISSSENNLTENNIASKQEEPFKNKYANAIYVLFTAIAILCIFIYRKLMITLMYSNNGQAWQIENRYLVSLLFTIFILSCCFSLQGFRRIFSNKVMVFLSSISFQLYIWHQVISTKLKEFHIPAWEGAEPPNMTGDKVWIWKYFLLIWVITIIVATLFTYFFERPLAKLISRESRKKS